MPGLHNESLLDITTVRPTNGILGGSLYRDVVAAASPTHGSLASSGILTNLWPRSLGAEGVLSPQHSVSSSGGALGGTIDTSILLTPSQRKAVQAVACALAGLTLCTVFVSLYWFSLMRKKFRHRLIMMLIIADFIRSLWLFIFPAVSLARGRVSTSSPFCQISGYFTQSGTEMADFSTLSIAVHTALQILKPEVNFHGFKETGLHRYRYPVFTTIAVAPLVLAALPFIRSKYGYLSQGAFCTLPLRPFWYRLATAWIPRYIILLTIFCLYIAIYVYVWRHFKRSPILMRRRGEAGGGSLGSPFDTSATTESRLDGTASDLTVRPGGAYMDGRILGAGELPHQLDSAAILEWRNTFALRRESDGTTLVDPSSPMHMFDEGTRSKRASLNRHSQGYAEMGGFDGGIVDHVLMPRPKNPPIPLNPSERNGSEPQLSHSDRTMSRELQRNSMERRYKAIKHQLNLLFVYPIVYFFIWLIPLGYNICNYNEHLVQHPVFALVLLNTACNSIMGFVDCVVFSVRESPWRHIPGSDGTFWGSFLFWKHVRVDSQRHTSSIVAQPNYSNRHSLLTEGRSSYVGMPTTRRRIDSIDWLDSRHPSIVPNSGAAYGIGSETITVPAIDEEPKGTTEEEGEEKEEEEKEAVNEGDVKEKEAAAAASPETS